MVLSFNEAVDYLKGMFPTWDRDSLAAMLSANEGRMGRTIDEILNMDAKNQGPSKSPSQPSRIQIMRAKRPSIQTPKRVTIDGSTGEAIPSPRSFHGGSPSNNSMKRPSSTRRTNPNYRTRVEHNVVYRGVKFILPDTFLALPEDPSKLAGKKKRRSILDDEKLAHLLKNEQFRHRLEVYGYSFRPGEGPESIRDGDHSSSSTLSSASSSGLERSSSNLAVIPVDDPKTISSLGEVTRRNLSMLAFRFIHGVDEMTPVGDGKQVEFDFDDVYDKDDAQELDESSKTFKLTQTSPREA